jgi:hypothetical protein
MDAQDISDRENAVSGSTSAQGSPSNWKRFVRALLVVALIYAIVWYARRPHPDEKLIPGSWLVQLSDGSRMLWVVNRDHHWTTWDVDAAGRTTQRSSGRWSFDGETILVRENDSGISLFGILLGQKSSDDKVYLDLESLRADQLVTRYRTNGDRLEWNRQPADASP